MKFARSFLLLVVCPALALAQGASDPGPTNCDVKLADAPALRGFRLGDELAEVKRRYPQFRYIRDDAVGAETAYIYRYTRHVHKALDGVNSAMLRFVDGRLTSIEMYFEKPRWPSVGVFAAKASEALGLPQAWAGDRTLSLTCDGFSVEASLPVPSISHLSMRADGVETTINARRLDGEQRRRQAP